MPLDPRASQTPFPGLHFCGADDDIERMTNDVAMSADWEGYFNARVLTAINMQHKGRVTYVACIADGQEGQIIIVPCKKEDYGATKVEYSKTENAATINLRIPCQKLEVEPLPDRVRVFKVGTRRAPTDQKDYVTLQVKGSDTRPTKKRNPSTETEEEKPE